MRKKTVLLLLLGGVFFITCRQKSEMSITEVTQDERPDGFVDSWTEIIPTDPPPPEPFSFLRGEPVNLNWLNRPGTGRDNEMKVRFSISMGAVENVDATAGNAAGMMGAKAKVERALGTWHFTNSGWGPVTMTLNFGSKRVALDWGEFYFQKDVELARESFYAAFSGQKGNIDFRQVNLE